MTDLMQIVGGNKYVESYVKSRLAPVVFYWWQRKEGWFECWYSYVVKPQRRRYRWVSR